PPGDIQNIQSRMLEQKLYLVLQPQIALKLARPTGAKVWSEMNAQNRLCSRVHEHAKSGPPDRRATRRALPRSLPGEGVRQGDQGPAAAGEGDRCARHG